MNKCRKRERKRGEKTSVELLNYKRSPVLRARIPCRISEPVLIFYNGSHQEPLIDFLHGTWQWQGPLTTQEIFFFFGRIRDT